MMDPRHPPDPDRSPPDTTTKNKFRIEFNVPKDSVTFNLASATKSVLIRLRNIDSSIVFFSSADLSQQIDLSDFPTSAFPDIFNHEISPPRSKSTTITVIVGVQSFYPAAHFFRHSGFASWLRSNNIWLRDHHFTNVRVVRLGFVFFRHPDHTFRTDLKTAIHSHLSSHFPASDEHPVLPHFEIHKGSFTHIIPPEQRLADEASNIRISTFEIRCSLPEKAAFLDLFDHHPLPEHIGTFSPITRSPEMHDSLTKLIRLHMTHILSIERHIIEGLPLETATNPIYSPTLSTQITNLFPGSFLERTSKTASHGRWFLLLPHPPDDTIVLRRLDDILAKLSREPDTHLRRAQSSTTYPRTYRCLSPSDSITSASTRIHTRNNSRFQTHTAQAVPKFVSARSLQLTFGDNDDFHPSAQALDSSSVATPITANTKQSSTSNLTIETIKTMQTAMSNMTESIRLELSSQRDHFKSALTSLNDAQVRMFERQEARDAAREAKRDEADRRQQQILESLLYLQHSQSTPPPSPTRKARRTDDDPSMDVDPRNSPDNNHAATSTTSNTIGPATPTNNDEL